MASFPNSLYLFILREIYVKIRNENNFPKEIFFLSLKIDNKSSKKYKKIVMQNKAGGTNNPFNSENIV